MDLDLPVGKQKQHMNTCNEVASSDQESVQDLEFGKRPIKFEAVTDSEGEVSSDQLDRPNRWNGAPLTWLNLTAKERDIAKSLDVNRSNDLSLHLYSSFALKQRLRPLKGDLNLNSWESKEKWTDEASRKAWRPPRYWTAWPLEPEIVPRPEERFGHLPDEEFLRSEPRLRETWNPRYELKETILATLLRHANDNFRKRRWSTPLPAPASASDVIQSQHTVDLKTDTSSSTPQSSRSQAHNDVDMASNSAKKRQNISDSSSVQSGISDDESECSTKMHFELSDDDDRARRILAPATSSLLSKIDGLLMALQTSQQYRTGTGKRLSGQIGLQESSSDSSRKVGTSRSPSQHLSDTENDVRSMKRRRGRPKKSFSEQEIENARRAFEQDQERSSRGRDVSRGKGRPRIYQKPHPGETYYMMRKRTASEQSGTAQHTDESQEKVMPHISSPKRPSSQHGRSRSRRSLSRASSRSSNSGYENTGLRDWSSVIGLASLSGWDQEVVARASRRCTAIFDESMTFRDLQEEDALGVKEDPISQKTDDAAPDTYQNVEDDPAYLKGRDDIDLRFLKYLLCPHGDCARHTIEFPTFPRLTDHIVDVHGYRIRNSFTDEQNTLMGGVHVDGFMEPVQPRFKGERGPGKAVESQIRNKKRKRREKPA